MKNIVTRVQSADHGLLTVSLFAIYLAKHHFQVLFCCSLFSYNVLIFKTTYFIGVVFTRMYVCSLKLFRMWRRSSTGLATEMCWRWFTLLYNVFLTLVCNRTSLVVGLCVHYYTVKSAATTSASSETHAFSSKLWNSMYLYMSLKCEKGGERMKDTNSKEIYVV